jgi:hypothetical protein
MVIERRADLVAARAMSNAGHPVSLLFTTPHGAWADGHDPADQALLDWAAKDAFRMVFNAGHSAEQATSLALHALTPGVSPT